MDEKKDKRQNNSEKTSYFLHQDNLYWNRLQTLGVIQIAVLSGAYALKNDKIFAGLILILGVVLSLLTFFLLKRDELIRNELEKDLGGFKYEAKRRWFAPLKGREITWLLIVILLFADIVLWFYGIKD